MLTFTVICTIGLFYVINAAILWVKPAETPPSCRQNSHAAILWVVGHTTKHMTHSRSWDTEIWRPSVENVTLGLRPRVTFSTSGRHITMSHSLLCVICQMNYTRRRPKSKM